ncbi:MAG: hypothetical protein K8S55_11355 [Phycisphaerae bacterium]|nr:hypothetical protein [Phycisphaerae bacterium]
MKRLPCWGVAILLVLPLLALMYIDLATSSGAIWSRILSIGILILFLISLFLPGAIKRLSWRHCLVMLVFAAAAVGVEFGIAMLPIKWAFPYIFLVGAIPSIILVGLGEWILSKHKSLYSLFAVCFTTLAVGCVASLAYQSFRFTEYRLTITSWTYGGERTVHVFQLFYLLSVILTWIFLPPVLRLSHARKRVALYIAAGAMAVSIATVSMFYLAIYPLAVKSLDGHGPFGKASAATILEARGREADFKTLWRAVEKNDWSQQDKFPPWWDYRHTWIGILARHDLPTTAERLSRLVRKNPAERLAGASASVFAKQKRYETVPILMWYALEGGIDGDNCQKALVNMQLPRATLPIIRNARGFGSPLYPDCQAKLTGLLKHDAGSDLNAWAVYYDKVIGSIPTPLPEQYKIETDRVINCAVSYWDSRRRLDLAVIQLFIRTLKEAGKEDVVRALKKVGYFAKAHPKANRWVYWNTEVDPKIKAQWPEIMSLHNKAYRDMNISPPVWNSPGVDALEKAVDEYAKRVDAKILKYLGDSPPTKNTRQK